MLRGFISSTVTLFVTSAVLLAIAAMTLHNLYNTVDHTPNAATKLFVNKFLTHLHGVPRSPNEDICEEEGVTCRGSYVRLNFAGKRVRTMPEVGADWGPYVLVDSIDLTNAKLRGSFPDSWRYLFHLKHLNLSKNPRLTGAIPKSWESLVQLEELNIRGCSACHGLPAWDLSSTSLKKVDFAHNQFRGHLASEWAYLNVAEVDLSGNHFCGCVPESWSGTLLAAVAGMRVSGASCANNTCENYDVCSGANTGGESDSNSNSNSNGGDGGGGGGGTGGSSDNDEDTSVVGNDWATRQFMYQMYKEYRDQLPDWTGGDYCKYSGVTCARNGEVTVNLRGRGLKGEMPDVDRSWGRLSKVVSIDMSSNPGLRDSFEKDWRYLTRLRFLNLSYTNLDGNVPDKWTELVNLEEVYITNTFACKRLPEWRGSYMTKLRVIDFSSNHFYGKLRDSWGTILSLTSVNVAANKFCGCVPSAWKNNVALMVAVQNLEVADPSRCDKTKCTSSCS